VLRSAFSESTRCKKACADHILFLLSMFLTVYTVVGVVSCAISEAPKPIVDCLRPLPLLRGHLWPLYHRFMQPPIYQVPLNSCARTASATAFSCTRLARQHRCKEVKPEVYFALGSCLGKPRQRRLDSDIRRSPSHRECMRQFCHWRRRSQRAYAM